MCKVSEGENAFAKIGEALDNLNSRGTGSGSSILGIRRTPPDSREPGPATPGQRLFNGCDSDAQFPTELISSCIAMILMIQVNHSSPVHSLDLRVFQRFHCVVV
jgi:hypothetical protein